MTPLSRRQFIGTTAATTTGISLQPNLVEVFGNPAQRDLMAKLPTIPYGAVYFRKSAPPRADWERDYAQAAKDGMNIFRHWFMWSAIEVAPGVYDWDDYDRQLELAARYGIKTIIADIFGTAPEWAFLEFPHARVEDASGNKRDSGYTGACSVGGSPGLCLDNEDVLERADAFFRAMVNRYKDHPGMGGYDVWNELNMNGGSGGCWCDASAEKFRGWLKAKYGSLDKLTEAWNRFSYRGWDDVQIPTHNGFYCDSIDWILFRQDNAYRLMKWRVDLIKSLDAKNPVTSHGIVYGTLNRVGQGTYNVWKAGDMVDGFGFSGGDNHQEGTRRRWLHWCIADITRAGSGDKPFWCAEMASGYSWGARGRKMDEGRMATANDIRLFSMTSFAAGTTGILSPRWRPLLNGHHVGNFGFYDMDGSPTDRSRMAGEVAKWANHKDQAELWKARPVRGDMGIIVVPESQIQDYLKEGNTNFYYRAINGVYQACLDNNIQADFVYSERINNDYRVLYLPYPIMLPRRVAEALKDFVREGGTLISEGCPGYFDETGEAGTRQPNFGLDDLFGATQSYVQFTPDLPEDLKINIDGREIDGGIHLQVYKPGSGTVAGKDFQGRPMVVDNIYGSGKTRLIGTSPGFGYIEGGYADDGREFFAHLLKWSGIKQHVTCSDPRLRARLHAAKDFKTLWIVNSEKEEIRAEFKLAGQWGTFEKMKEVVNRGSITASGNTLSGTIPARDVTVISFG